MTVYVLYEMYIWGITVVTGVVSTLEAAKNWEMSSETASYCGIELDGEIKPEGYL